MKKLLTAVLVLSMVLGLCFVPSVSAATLKEITLFETDFENDTVGEGAKALKGFSGDSSSEKAGIVEQGTAESGNETKYFDTYGKANQRFRMIFDEAVSSGKFVAEFDLNAGLGSAALGILYSSDLNTYAKWPVFCQIRQKNSTAVVKGYLEANAGTPPTDIEGKTVTFTKASDGENLTFTANTWQHYRVDLDIDNGSVTVYVDGVKSAVMTGYKYFKDSPIGGLAFYMKKLQTAPTIQCSTILRFIKNTEIIIYIKIMRMEKSEQVMLAKALKLQTDIWTLTKHKAMLSDICLIQ